MISTNARWEGPVLNVTCQFETWEELTRAQQGRVEDGDCTVINPWDVVCHGTGHVVIDKRGNAHGKCQIKDFDNCYPDHD